MFCSNPPAQRFGLFARSLQSLALSFLPTASVPTCLVLSRASPNVFFFLSERHLYVAGVLSVYSARAERAGRPAQLELSESHPACAARQHST